MSLTTNKWVKPQLCTPTLCTNQLGLGGTWALPLYNATLMLSWQRRLGGRRLWLWTWCLHSFKDIQHRLLRHYCVNNNDLVWTGPGLTCAGVSVCVMEGKSTTSVNHFGKALDHSSWQCNYLVQYYVLSNYTVMSYHQIITIKEPHTYTLTLKHN